MFRSSFMAVYKVSMFLDDLNIVVSSANTIVLELAKLCSRSLVLIIKRRAQ